MIWGVVSLAFTAAAHAVPVRVVEGDVYVSAGNGYDPVPGTANAKVGDSIMAGEYGVGEIVYSPTCVVTLRPGTVVTVEAGLPKQCSGADESTADESTNDEATSGGLSTGTILLGVGVAGGIGVGIYAATSGGDSDKGASP
jgi:hypothetical protein